MSEMGEFAPNLQEQVVKPVSVSKTGEKLINLLGQSEVDFSVIRTGVEEAPEIFVLGNQTENSTEKCVRVYRSVGRAETVLNQMPYAMREADGSLFSGPEALGIKKVVNDLATEPTYEKLIEYIKLASKNGGDVKTLQGKLRRLEDGVLKGSPFSKELKFATFGHTAGNVMESDIVPYMSAAFHLEGAWVFANGFDGAVMVIDVPVSQLSFFNNDVDKKAELFINGVLDSKNIRAVIPKIGDINHENEEDILGKINGFVSNIPGNVISESELLSVVSDVFDQRKNIEVKNDEISLKLIQNKRAKELVDHYSRAIPEIEDLMTESQEDVDVYTKTMRVVFDAYDDRLKKIGLSLDEFQYKKGNLYSNTEDEKYDRTKVSELMLSDLARLVNYEQERYDLRQERLEQRRKLGYK